MKVWYPVLVAATILGIVWCVLVAKMFPLGFADGLHGGYKRELAARIDDVGARRVISEITRRVADFTVTVVIAVAVPLVAISIGWGILVYCLLDPRNDRGEK